MRAADEVKGLCMRELRSAAEEPADRAGGPLTADAATRAVRRFLGEVLDERMSQAYDLDAVFARDVAGRVSAFARRGGKRLRTAFAWCGWRAGGGTGDPGPLLRTGVALELVQTCALVHDDVMDGSHLRRGAPSMHVDLARMHRAEGMTGGAEAFGHSAAVLAGDLALAWADDLMTETALAAPNGPRLYQEWRAMREEMVAGQYRDLQAQAAGASGVEEALTIATLKSALYTVERPLALGASLAGADETVTAALRAVSRCAGLAFQLRDDLLGAFGDPALTGKPVGTTCGPASSPICWPSPWNWARRPGTRRRWRSSPRRARAAGTRRGGRTGGAGADGRPGRGGGEDRRAGGLRAAALRRDGRGRRGAAGVRRAGRPGVGRHNPAGAGSGVRSAARRRP